MAGGMSKMAKRELLATIRDRYRASSKNDKTRILDEFVAVTGHHRKHAIPLLRRSDDAEGAPRPVRGQRAYDAAVREMVIMVWEAADRICGKRLKAAMPHLVESMERHGHLELDPEVRSRLRSASAATLDRLLKPIRPTAGSRRRPRRGRSMGKRVPVRTYNDWNGPPPGFLESTWWPTAAAPCPDHSSTAWLQPTSAPAGPRRFPSWPRSNPWWWRAWKPSHSSCHSPFWASTPTTTAHSSTKR